jgi:ferric-dicitrate binding protein FerR (iron transport regulator)
METKFDRETELLKALDDGDVPAGLKDVVRGWFAGLDTERQFAIIRRMFAELTPNLNPDRHEYEMWDKICRLIGLTLPERKRGLIFRLVPGRVAARVAAVLIPVIVALGVSWWVIGTGDRTAPVADVEVSASEGETKQVTLSDGTMVTLDPGATLTYADVLADDRIVTLSGQARFDVAEALDAAGGRRSFSVRTTSFDVDVTGTVFRIDATGGSEFSSVALYKGAVNVRYPEGNVGLHPGERCSHNNYTNENTVSLIPASEMISNGATPLLRFDGSSIANLMLALESNFGVGFAVSPGIDTSGGAISADFEGLSIDKIVSLLSITDKLYSYTLDGNTITITQKKSNTR